mgnify:CR=1 FL=1
MYYLNHQILVLGLMNIWQWSHLFKHFIWYYEQTAFLDFFYLIRIKFHSVKILVVKGDPQTTLSNFQKVKNSNHENFIYKLLRYTRDTFIFLLQIVKDRFEKPFHSLYRIFWKTVFLPSYFFFNYSISFNLFFYN